MTISTMFLHFGTITIRTREVMFLPGIIIDSVNQVAFKRITAWWI